VVDFIDSKKLFTSKARVVCGTQSGCINFTSLVTARIAFAHYWIVYRILQAYPFSFLVLLLDNFLFGSVRQTKLAAVWF